jgi:hypothetical protein
MNNSSKKSGSARGPVDKKLTGSDAGAAMFQHAYPHPYRNRAGFRQDRVTSLGKSFDYRELMMTDGMDERRKGFEAKWAHDAELRFEVEARRNRALGLWAAAQKGLSGQAVEDFVGSVIAADFEEAGDEDVFRKLRSELEPSVSDAVIRDKMRTELEAAIKALS